MRLSNLLHTNVLRLTITLATVLAVTGSALAAPQPSPVPKRWELDVKLGTLHVANVEHKIRNTDGSERKVVLPYLYTTFMVTNFSGQDLLFAPQFAAAFDNGEMIIAGEDVPAAVSDELLKRLNNPFLEDQISILGNLAQGEENAREGLVVWPLRDIDVDEIVIYAAGFSGEIKTLTLIDPDTGDPVRVTLRKTLTQRYRTPGTIDTASSRAIRRAGLPEWKMR